MAYCLYTDVASEFKDIDFTANSSVSSTEVTGFIAQADAEIDSYLGTVYTVPITGTAALLIVKQISIWLVAYRIKEILFVKTAYPNKEQEIKKDLRQLALDMLNKLAKKQILLPDAEFITSTLKDYNSNNDITPYWQRAEKQW